MKEVIIIKYGELSTKGGNLNFFIKKLKTNIEKSLKGLDYELVYDHGRMFITAVSKDIIVSKLQKVFGIHEINTGYLLNTNDLDTVKNKLIELLSEKEFKTFKVITKRSYKQYPLDSMEISRNIGTHLLKSIQNITVDVHNPELEVNIEIRKDEAVIYFDKIKGLGGYPVGTQGKGFLMLSGGIDSPVAGYLAIKRGINLQCVYFDSPPHTSEKAKKKVIDLAKKLQEYNPDLKLYIVNFTSMQEEILKKLPHEYLITIMRRMMYRITEAITINNKGLIIVNGESIGQVASQTLTSMNCINEVVKTPVIRPVACFDKLEIIDYAKKIDTYETSILPYEDCCTVFVPKHPVINPVSSLCVEYEKLFDYQVFINDILNNIEINYLDNEIKHKDLL